MVDSPQYVKTRDWLRKYVSAQSAAGIFRSRKDRYGTREIVEKS
jgi:hypothetical protein